MRARHFAVATLAALVGGTLTAVPAQAYGYGPDEVFATYDGIEYVAFADSPEQGAWVLNGGAVGGDVVIPPTVDIDGVNYSVVLIADNAFDSQGVDSVVLPDTLQSIGEYAFRYNHLTSVDFPDSVTSIGVGAFSENSLTSVTLPAHLDSVEPWAFALNGITTLHLNQELVSIGSNAFQSNHLTSVTFPASVEAIHGSAFRYTPLGSITFEGDAPDLDGPETFGTNDPLLSFYHDAQGFTTPTWSGGYTEYQTQMIDPVSVTFDANGHGTAPGTATVRPNWPMADPGALTETGHTFTGWSTEASGGTLVAFPYTVTVDTALYAQWEINSYAVTFEPGTGDSATTETADYNASIDAPTPPTRTGHTLMGWFTDATAGTQASFPHTVTGDETWYAQWDVNAHTVAFEPENGDAATPVAADYDTTVDEPSAPTRAHYDFTGWFTAASGGTQVTFPYVVEGDSSLFAQWELDTHTITINAQNYGSNIQHVVAYGSQFTPVTPTYPGHTFTGWWGSPTKHVSYSVPLTVTGDVTLYAHWSVNEYTVTFDPENGDAVTPVAADYDTTVDEPTAPTRAHYAFAGWFTAANGGTEVDFPYVVQDDATLYAQWEIDTHSLTFDFGDGTTPTSQTLDYHASLGAPTTHTRIGHTFVGWFTDSSGGTQVTFPYTVTGNATLYGQWTVNEYTLTFEPNNGEAAHPVDSDYGTTVAAPATPSHASFAFTGWFTAAHGGTQVAFPYTVTGDETLYAQWTALPASISAPATAATGSTVTVSGENFTPGETVEVWLLSTPVLLTSVVVGDDGTFSVHVTIPKDIPQGAHHIEVRGSTTATMSSPVTVTAVLATTGADVAGTVGLSALLTLAGVAIIVTTRRKLRVL